MTSVGQVQQLTAEERTLLRAVFTWARAEGWRRDHELSEEASRFGKSYRDWHWWGGQDRVFVERTTFKHNADDWRLVGVTPRGGVEHHVDGVMDLRRAVDVLAALGVLPAQFSGAYRQHALDVWSAVHDMCDETKHETDSLFALGQCDGMGKAAGIGLQLARHWQEGFAETVAWARNAAKGAPDADVD